MNLHVSCNQDCPAPNLVWFETNTLQALATWVLPTLHAFASWQQTTHALHGLTYHIFPVLIPPPLDFVGEAGDVASL